MPIWLIVGPACWGGTSNGELWDPKLKGRFLMETPKATQSL